MYFSRCNLGVQLFYFCVHTELARSLGALMPIDRRRGWLHRKHLTAAVSMHALRIQELISCPIGCRLRTLKESGYARLLGGALYTHSDLSAKELNANYQSLQIHTCDSINAGRHKVQTAARKLVADGWLVGGRRQQGMIARRCEGCWPAAFIDRRAREMQCSSLSLSHVRRRRRHLLRWMALWGCTNQRI